MTMPRTATARAASATFSGDLSSSDIGLIVRLILSPTPKPCGARAVGDLKPDRQSGMPARSLGAPWFVGHAACFALPRVASSLATFLRAGRRRRKAG